MTMATLDAVGNVHRGAGAPDGGQFDAKHNSRPAGLSNGVVSAFRLAEQRLAAARTAYHLEAVAGIRRIAEAAGVGEGAVVFTIVEDYAGQPALVAESFELAGRPDRLLIGPETAARLAPYIDAFEGDLRAMRSAGFQIGSQAKLPLTAVERRVAEAIERLQAVEELLDPRDWETNAALHRCAVEVIQLIGRRGGLSSLELGWSPLGDFLNVRGARRRRSDGATEPVDWYDLEDGQDLEDAATKLSHPDWLIGQSLLADGPGGRYTISFDPA